MFIKFQEIREMSDHIRMLTGDDEDTFLDTLDGETDAMDILGKLIQERTECKIYEASVKELAATYTARAKRLSNKQDALAITIGHLLDAIGQTKIQHPLATVSRTKPRAKVIVVDQNDIPSQLTTVTVKPDLVAIKKQMDAGEIVPGCEYQMGNSSVTVRIK
tara:strand:+ start:1435 stop:1920 length:486 start_codon:yes stop_codon:yes gene_type:complete